MSDHDLDPVDERLRDERPAPAPGFRRELRRRLVAKARIRQPLPPRLVLLVAAYSVSGGLLLALAAIGVAGCGPLAS